MSSPLHAARRARRAPSRRAEAEARPDAELNIDAFQVDADVCFFRNAITRGHAAFALAS